VDLQIEHREIDGIVILDLKGRLILGEEDLTLRQTVSSLVDAGDLNLILNMKDVSQIDTAALGTLVFCQLKLRESGGRLILLNLAPSHAKLSNIMKLNTTFETYQEEHLALNSFFPDRAVPRYDILDFVEELEQRRPAKQR
jgi:anti-anti-sigma factor